MRLACLSAVFLLASGCESNWPGTPVGAYHVTATLASNTCGAALTAPATLSFDVEIRKDSGFAYWRRRGFPVQSGGFDTTGAFQFNTTGQVAASGGGDSGVPICAIIQTETIHGTSVMDEDDEGGVLDAGSGPDGGVLVALMGADDIDVSPAAGTNCASQLSVYGGPFPMLPCHVQYVLSGAVAPPFQ